MQLETLSNCWAIVDLMARASLAIALGPAVYYCICCNNRLESEGGLLEILCRGHVVMPRMYGDTLGALERLLVASGAAY